jgi:hypothetical protein
MYSWTDVIFASTETGGAEGITMISAIKGCDHTALRMSRLLPELKGHADRYFDRSRSIVGIENAC